ncbi:hypothetical protein FA95DRAFT_1499170, partial [Auriscalpium vulgare]
MAAEIYDQTIPWNPETYDETIPLPRGISNWVPMSGSYVVFRLNPVATLEALRDPIATEQAHSLPKRRYVGTILEVSTSCRHPESRSRLYYDCDLFLLSQGLPKALPMEGIDEIMCIPIHPANHPKGRESISPTPPLPWDDLYHHTTLHFDVRVRS